MRQSISRRSLLTATAAAAASLGLLSCGTAPGPGLASEPLAAKPEAPLQPPPAPREFRAAWVATVSNIDWPSRKGLSSAEQQLEMRALLDRAVALKLNAVILQVRTSADALYASELEPWSEYLSGTQGVSPGYDPLRNWIAEAHQRGLELHAWFNPFRARQSSLGSKPAANHVSRAHPQWVKRYGDQLWIDPGEPEAAAHTLAVVMDVLKRYDVDAIHIDDYFYPYPLKQPGDDKADVDFPDQPSWQRYLDGGGRLERADWRRSNVDALIARLYAGIRQTKPWVRFGISPFGLGRPELRPPGIQGFSQYDKLFANVERWMAEGWLDYLVPQLYWPIDQQAQAFGALLDYWHQQNPRGRHVWPGLYTSRVLPATGGDKSGWEPAEILNQIALVRSSKPGTGHVHFSMVSLQQNRRGLAGALAAQAYAVPALVPASPWLEASLPLAPLLKLTEIRQGSVRLAMQAGSGSKPVLRWALWLRYGERWEFRVAHKPEILLPASGLDAVFVSAVDRVGNEGPRTRLALPK